MNNTLLHKQHSAAHARAIKLTRTLNKGGRPRSEDLHGKAKEDAQAFESAKVKWNYLSMYLAEQAIKCARGDKKGLSQIVTSAAIAYDKAFSKRDNDTVNISVPASLATSIRLALQIETKDKGQDQVKVMSDNECYVNYPCASTGYGQVQGESPEPGQGQDAGGRLDLGQSDGGVGMATERVGTEPVNLQNQEKQQVIK